MNARQFFHRALSFTKALQLPSRSHVVFNSPLARRAVPIIAAGTVSLALLHKHLFAHEEYNIINENEEAVQLIQELDDHPDYVRVGSTHVNLNAETRNYLRSRKQGTSDIKKFEFVVFYSKKDERTISIVFCGKHVEGPPGCVHGGATASIIDSTMGANLWRSGYFSVTANLNVNYRKFIPLEQVIVCESWVDRVEGRKIFVAAKVRSLDNKTVHAEATGLWIKVDIHKMKQDRAESSQK